MKGLFVQIMLLSFLISCKDNASIEKQINTPFSSDINPPIKEPVLFTLMSPLHTGVRFINQLTETTDMNGFFYEYYYNGAGVSISDINNDGLQDLLFLSNLRQNQLYLNQGNLKFIDITETSGIGKSLGYPTGITNVDINHDGLMDYYISKSGRYDEPYKRKNELWVNMGANNEGIPVFTEEASKYNLDIDMCSTQAAFFDYDLDGDLDMFLINHYPSPLTYTKIDELGEKEGILTGDRLFENKNGKYINVTKKAGLTNTSRLSYGLGISVGDLNNDGWPDVYVANDYEGKDFLYLNKKNKTFSDVANEATGHVSYFSMGTDISDVNNDGWLDFMSLDMMAEDNYTMKTSMGSMDPRKFADVVGRGLHYQYMYNALQINNGVVAPEGVPLFSDVAQLSGVASTDWSWGPLFFDMDNDGHKDLFISNGIKRDFRNNDFLIKQRTSNEKVSNLDRDAYIKKVLSEMPGRKKLNYFFKNNGDLTFTNTSSQWLMDIPTSSNGAAYGDLDNDGDLDLVVNNSDDASLIYRNNASELGLGGYLKIKLVGSDKNTKGVGARVKLRHGKNIQVQEYYPTRGFQSAIGTVLHYGLGENKSIEELTVIWPDGKRQILENIEGNQELVLNYVDAEKKKNPGIKESQTAALFTTSGIDIGWSHRENDFNDFEGESLLPHKMSRFGPALAVGDFDGDQLEDLFLGGAHDQSPILFMQITAGKFQPVQQNFFENQKYHEDVDALFIDADKDGDLDLYVVSGGNEKEITSGYYQDRLYENDSGIFKYQKEALPRFLSSGSCVKTIDYDSDGDLDLFIGGRQLPGRYPTAVKSYLLRNDSKKGKIQYADVTDKILPDLNPIGMVTDAISVDLNNDQKHDLILVGEWMSLRLFQNTGKGFMEVTADANLLNSTGWWNTIKAADFDKDGDLDLIAGNLGLNYKYKASPQQPFNIFGDDFDRTGTFDIVLGYYEGETLYPLRGRECSSSQMPFIKEKFPTYEAFGKASLEEVYGIENLSKAVSYSSQTFATIYFENNGDGTYTPRPLVNDAQISSVNDIVIEDIDEDGNLDLILAGNLYGSEVETPRNDAGWGLFMRGDGNGDFFPIPMNESGLLIPGEVRHIRKLHLTDDKELLVFARNNEQPIFVKWK